MMRYWTLGGFKGGKVSHEKLFTLPNGEKVNTLMVESNSITLGQKFPFNPIMINTIVEGFTLAAQHRVVSHELGHAKTNFILKIFLLPILFFSAIVLSITLLVSPVMLLYIIFLLWHYGIGPALTLFIELLASITFWGIILFVSNFISELCAELYCLQVLGGEAFLSAIKEAKEKSTGLNKTLADSLIVHTYPKPEFTIWFHSLFKR